MRIKNGSPIIIHHHNNDDLLVVLENPIHHTYCTRKTPFHLKNMCVLLHHSDSKNHVFREFGIAVLPKSYFKLPEVPQLLDDFALPSGKLFHNYGKLLRLMGNLTMSMPIFHGYITNYQRVNIASSIVHKMITTQFFNTVYDES